MSSAFVRVVTTVVCQHAKKRGVVTADIARSAGAGKQQYSRADNYLMPQKFTITDGDRDAETSIEK